MKRRHSLALLAGACSMPVWGGVRAAQARPVFRFGVTDVFIHDAIPLLRRYIEAQLGVPVRIVQKASYQEALEALRSDEMEAAWICGYPYVVAQHFVRLCAQPGWHGQPWYRSYLITAAERTQAHDLAALRGDVFAFDDPLSNSGYLVPVVALRAMGQTPQSFFRGSFYTYALDKVVEAVGAGLADSGTVDGYIWEVLQRRSDPAARKTRVVAKSRHFGFPPIVTRRSLAPELHQRLQDLLLGAHAHEQGRELLSQLDLHAFLRPQPAWFDGIQTLVDILDGTRTPLPVAQIYQTG
jgi:phosphonate transport system substrate-binding protein